MREREIYFSDAMNIKSLLTIRIKRRGSLFLLGSADTNSAHKNCGNQFYFFALFLESELSSVCIYGIADLASLSVLAGVT